MLDGCQITQTENSGSQPGVRVSVHLPQEECGEFQGVQKIYTLDKLKYYKFLKTSSGIHCIPSFSKERKLQLSELIFNIIY